MSRSDRIVRVPEMINRNYFFQAQPRLVPLLLMRACRENNIAEVQRLLAPGDININQKYFYRIENENDWWDVYDRDAFA